MACRHDGAEAEARRLGNADGRAERRIEEDADLNTAGAQATQDAFRAMDIDGKGHERIGAIEARQHIGEELGDGALDHRDRDMAAPEAAQLLELRAGTAIILLPSAHALDEDLAGRSEAQPARQALEEWRAEFILELQDLAVDCGRGDVEAVGRPADRALTHDLVEIADEGGEDRHQRLPWREPAGNPPPPQ